MHTNGIKIAIPGPTIKAIAPLLKVRKTLFVPFPLVYVHGTILKDHS